MQKFITLVFVALLAVPTAASAQDERRSLSLSEYWEALVGLLRSRVDDAKLPASKEKPYEREDPSEPEDPYDSWEGRLYTQLVGTKLRRQQLVAALREYEGALKRNTGILEREENYLRVGFAADALLTEVERLTLTLGELGARLDLRDRQLADTLGMYVDQRGSVLHAVLDRPKLFGLKQSDLADLLAKMETSGKHLDVAIDSIRETLLKRFPDKTLLLPHPRRG